MRNKLPPIVKQAEGLMRDIEIAVSHFPRRHRYTVGARLSNLIMEVTYNSHQAWRLPEQSTLEALAKSIDRLKLQLQLAQQIHAFSSFGQFELLARAAESLGKQCGGWQKRWTSKRQNEQQRAAAQRPQILSSHDASREANP
ncbi:MAG TPA: four helix bundle protein [Steroidobacteraceae bacterium]